MYEIYKDSQLYKFVSHHLGQDQYCIGGAGYYNYCHYARDIVKSVVLCVVTYGFLAYIGIWGVAPWFLWWLADYPAPLMAGSSAIEIASLFGGIFMAVGVFVGGLWLILKGLETTRLDNKIGSLIGRMGGRAVSDFVSTGYDAWKNKYCPLVEVKETKDVD